MTETRDSAEGPLAILRAGRAVNLYEHGGGRVMGTDQCDHWKEPTPVVAAAEAERIFDALRIVVATQDASLADDDIEFDDLFQRGLLKAVRDYTDEYHAEPTGEGRALVRRVLEAWNVEL